MSDCLGIFTRKVKKMTVFGIFSSGFIIIFIGYSEYRWKIGENSLKDIAEMTSAAKFSPILLSGNVQQDYNILEGELNKLMSSTCKRQKKKIKQNQNTVKGNLVQYYVWLNSSFFSIFNYLISYK